MSLRRRLELLEWAHQDPKPWHPIFSSDSDAFFMVGYGATRRVAKPSPSKGREPSAPGIRPSSKTFNAGAAICSPSCPTNEKGKAHDVINLRALATGHDFKQVIRELAAEVLPPLPVKTNPTR